MRPGIAITLALAIGFAGCQHEKPAQLYEKAPVERRTIVVSASASGAIEPVRTVEVKSKASGEIIGMSVETGDDVRAGDPLASIDPRTPRNVLAQAEANLEVAKAQLTNATTDLARSDTLFKTQAITETEYDASHLAYVNANAQVVRANADVETARDQMQDTEVRAPVSGTVIAKNVELGTVISSPTKDVGGGTALLKMANLDTVQIRTLVDETDIGKVEPGLAASIVVDAYPNRNFEGVVLKIEPMATVTQNVTMFPVLVRLANPGHLLRPGMNTEVEIHVGNREDVLAIPYSALRTSRDVASAAAVLGLDPAEVDRQLAESRNQGAESNAGANGGAGEGAGGAGTANAATPGPGAATPASGANDSTGKVPPGGAPASSGAAPSGPMLTLSDGRTIPLPAGVSEADARAAMDKRRSGKDLSPSEADLLRKLFAQFGGGRGGGGRGGGSRGGGMRGGDGGQSSRYIVFVLRNGKPAPVEIRTGLTDLDYIEVVSGLTEQDTVVVLPSASLVNSQREMQERMTRMTGGGGIPGMQQQGQRPSGTR